MKQLKRSKKKIVAVGLTMILALFNNCTGEGLKGSSVADVLEDFSVQDPSNVQPLPEPPPSPTPPLPPASSEQKVVLSGYFQSSLSKLCLRAELKAEASLTQGTCTSDSPFFEVLQGVESEEVQLRVKGSSFCVSFANASINLNRPTQLSKCDPSDSLQKFDLVKSNQGIQLKNRSSGMCLEIEGSSLNAGGRLEQWTCGAYDNSYFAFLEKIPVLPAPPEPIPTPQPPAPAAGKRWFPGFYLQSSAYPSRNGIDRVDDADTIRSNPNWQGIQVTIRWGVTEPQRDNYTELYKTLDEVRDWCRSSGKKAILRLFERSFEGDIPYAPFPQYIRDTGAWYDRGTLARLTNGKAIRTDEFGENIVAPKFWDPFVQERFLLWSEKVAEYAAANPEIVMVQSEEYSTWGAYRLPDFNPQGIKVLWREFARRITAKAGAALVHVNTGWSVDYQNLSANQAELAELMKYPIVLGPTDLRKATVPKVDGPSATLNTDFGKFMFNTPNQSPAGYRGIAPFILSYEWPDFFSTESPAEHFRFAVEDLGVHFITVDPDKKDGSGSSNDWRFDQAWSAVQARGGKTEIARPKNVN